jgi:Ni,Fe-hydrogenase I large subunit
MAKQTITVDPLTRIEGHLKIKVEVENGVVTNAFSSGEMFRGWEIILKGRSPIDAPPIVQRICGVCPMPHGTASVLALDDAFGVKPPANGRIIRNLMLGAEFIHSHLLHFYHLAALDFVDIKAILSYKGLDPKLNKIKDWVQSDIDAGSASAGAPFLPRYEGNYIQDIDINIEAIANYISALEYRRKAHEMLAIFGGKIPHCQTLFAGGVATRVTLDKIIAFKSRLSEIQLFVNNVYLPDVLAVASLFPEYFRIGAGVGNFMSYGGLPVDDNKTGYFDSGVFLDGGLKDFDPKLISEFVKFSKFSSGTGLYPLDGETVPDARKDGAYSWLKAPRYGKNVVEVGPLARAIITYFKGTNTEFKNLVDSALSTLGIAPKDLISTMGRHAARALELKLLVNKMNEWVDELVPSEPAHAGYDIPKTSDGMGLTEAARGSLGHWISVDNWRIRNYQAVVPTTWNGGPRDDDGTMGPFEQALIGTPVADVKNPIEIGRVIRSFDPCLACAVHILGADEDSLKFRVC